MLGGDHGKLKHGPPEGHSPVSESLMPKERLRIEPCFHLGNIPKGLVCGPAEVRDHTAFVPKPVDTSHVRVIYTVSQKHLLFKNNSVINRPISMILVHDILRKFDTTEL